MFKRITLIIVLAFLSACSTPGPLYNDYIQTTTVTADDNSASITVFRPISAQLTTLDASLKIDGLHIGNCSYMGFNTFKVQSGNHQLSVDRWDTPGSCEIPITLSASTSYFYEVRPRRSSTASAAILGTLGQALESRDLTCGGRFMIYEVNKKYAKQRLKFLRLSN